jgi:biotin carboxyl carrier protein
MDGSDRVGPMSISVTPGTTPGELVVREGDHVEHMYAVVERGTTWVFHEGVVYQIPGAETSQATAGLRTKGKRRTAAHETLTAPMPATVITVNVVPGDAVSRGDVLIVLEAMKMELPVRAPGDGRVKAVHCRPGQLVQPDVSLIDLV